LTFENENAILVSTGWKEWMFVLQKAAEILIKISVAFFVDKRLRKLDWI